MASAATFWEHSQGPAPRCRTEAIKYDILEAL